MSKDTKELSPEEKLSAVKEYLSGKGSTYSVADKYGVTDTSIRRWVDRYKIDGEQAFPKKHQASSLSPKEKLSAVHEYLQGALSLRDTARKYGVGDTSVRKWIVKYNVGGDEAFLSNHTRKYEAQGVESLTDKRGRTKPEAEMTELEKLRAENRLLKAQNKRQEMEMAFLKKLGEKWLTDITEMKYGVSCDWPFQ